MGEGTVVSCKICAIFQLLKFNSLLRTLGRLRLDKEGNDLRSKQEAGCDSFGVHA